MVDDPNFLNSWAWHLVVANDQRLRDGKLAVAIASKGCELTHFSDPNLLDTLAAAYAEIGDFERATELEHKAISIVNADTTSYIRVEFNRAIEAHSAKKTRHQIEKSKAQNSTSRRMLRTKTWKRLTT